MAFSDDKSAVLAAIKAKNCTAADFVAVNATDYPSLLECFFEFAKTFDCDPDYLATLLALVDPAELLTNNVYFNQSAVATATNPRLIVNSTITDVVLNSSFSGDLEIVHGSQVETLTVNDNATIGNITIASNAQVNLLAVESGAVVDAVNVKACGLNVGHLLQISSGSVISDVVADAGAEFGGFACVTEEPLP